MRQHAMQYPVRARLRSEALAIRRPRFWRPRLTHRHRVAIGGAAFLAELVLAVVVVGEMVR
jgi:hypothetical protein